MVEGMVHLLTYAMEVDADPGTTKFNILIIRQPGECRPDQEADEISSLAIV